MACEILRLNPELEHLLCAARRVYNAGFGAWRQQPPPLTLLHFSDIHGQQSSLRRIVALMEELEGMLEDVLCTGDLQKKNHAAGLEFWKEVPGSERILTCIGNHDVLNNDVYDWEDLIPAVQQAEEFIAPFYPHWSGVCWTPGTTWYSKRYSEQRILLVVLNSMLSGEDTEPQKAFFRAALEQARRESLTVVAAIHNLEGEMQIRPCAFSELAEVCRLEKCGGDTEGLQELVQEFQDRGGDFACWLLGHTHRDDLCVDPRFPRQMLVVVGGADPVKGLRHGDTPRTMGERSEDLFNFVTFEQGKGLVKLVRAGADRDYCLRSRKCLTFRWRTGEILVSE